MIRCCALRDYSRRPFLARVGGFLRVATLAVIGLAIVLLIALRSARATAAEALLGFGSELMRWPQMHAHSGLRTLSVNGIEFHLVTVSTPLSVKDATEHFHAFCKEHGGVQVPTKLEGAARMAKPFLPSSVDGTFSRVGEHEGVLACLDTGGPLDVSALGERLGRFADTGDLSHLGQLRYVLSRRDGDTTTALVLWTEGAVPILAAFPTSGDTPGVDPEAFPRRAGSRRLLSAREHGEPYSATVYVVEGDSAELEHWYETVLAQSSWHVRRVKSTIIVAERGKRRIMVHVSGPQRGQVTATVLELS